MDDYDFLVPCICIMLFIFSLSENPFMQYIPFMNPFVLFVPLEVKMIQCGSLIGLLRGLFPSPQSGSMV